VENIREGLTKGTRRRKLQANTSTRKTALKEEENEPPCQIGVKIKEWKTARTMLGQKTSINIENWDGAIRIRGGRE